MDLYKKLQSQSDTNLPIWNSLRQSEQTREKEKKYYERKHNPDFVNGLFDWTDYGITENFPDLIKAAYNNSITGLAYQTYNGEAKYDLSSYNPGIVEDVLSGVLSFVMPMDIASMAIGGKVIGAGFQAIAGGTKLAQASYKAQIANNLVKKIGISDDLAKPLSQKFYQDAVKEDGLGAILRAAAPKTAASINSASTLATFEGTRGGFQAAVDGTDIWEGIGKGVMHGGIMGSVIGGVGAGMAMKHAKLLAKTEDKFKKSILSMSKKELGEQAKLAGTGVPGQLVAEAGIFTSQDALKVLTDDEYTMRDYMRSFATNIGMMGLLKAKAKVIDKKVKPLWEQGKEELSSWHKRYKKNEGKLEELGKESFEKTKDVIVENATEVTSVTDAKAVENLQKFVKKVEKDVGLEPGDKIDWEYEFKKATDIIQRGDVSKLNVDDIVRVYHQIQQVHGAMIENIKFHKLYKPEKEGKIKELEDLAAKWEKEIMQPTNNLEVARNERESFSIDKRNEVAIAWESAKQHALKEGNLGALEAVKRGNETHLNKKNELDFDNFNIRTLEKQIEFYNKEFRQVKPQDPEASVSTQRGLAKENLKNVVREQKSTEDFKKEAEAIASDTTRPKVVDIAKKSEAIENANIGKEGSKTKEKYEESKIVLKLARDRLRKDPTKDSGRQLRDLGEIAKELAFEGRSLLEITNKDIEKYAKKLLGDTKISPSKKTRLSKVLEQLHEIHANTDYMGIFSSKDKSYITATKPFKEASNILNRFVSEKITKQGIIPSGKAKDANFEIKDGIIEIYTGKNKQGEADVKFVTKKTSDLLESLVKDTKLEGRKHGDDKFIFRTTDGTAIHAEVGNAVTVKIFGKDMRSFRYSLTEYAEKTFGRESEEYKIAYHLQQGHQQKVQDFYNRYGDKFTTKKAVRTFLDKYYKAFKDGTYKQEAGKRGFSSKQLKKGLEAIEGMKDTDTMQFKYKDTPKAKTFKTMEIDGKTLKTMFRYAIEGGPRINEIVPELETLKNARKVTKFQLETEIKLGEKAAGVKKLRELAEWAKEVAPELEINLNKADLGKLEGSYILGKITGHLVEIATGRAKADTIPHEVSHRVVDVLLATGTPQSKKLVKDGIEMFRKKGMSRAQAEEALVEAIGKYTLSRIEGKTKAPQTTINKTMFGKARNFVSRAVNYLRGFFGIRNKVDVNKVRDNIVSKIGEKVYTGNYKSDYMPTTTKTKYHTLDISTSAGKTEVYKIYNEIKGNKTEYGIEADAMKNYGLTSKQKASVKNEVFGQGKLDKNGRIKIDNVTVRDMENYQKALNQYIADRINGASSNLAVKRQKVIELEGERNVSESAREEYFDKIFDVKFENANDTMIKAYREQLIKQPKVEDKSNTITTQIFNEFLNKANVGSFNALKRASMRTGEVIEQWGAQSNDPAVRKLAKRIARTLREHDYVRNNYKQYGDKIVEEIKQILPKEITGEKVFGKKGYMDMIDPVHARETIGELYKLREKFNSRDYIGNAKFIDTKIKELEAIAEKFVSDPQFIKARKLWNDGGEGGLSNWYWGNLKKEIKGHVGGRTYKDIDAQLNKQYINGYMVKRLTKEALEGITRDNAQVVDAAQRIVKKLTIKDLVKIADELVKGQIIESKKSEAYKEILEKKGKLLKNHVADEVFNMITFGPNGSTIKPSFLKERGVTLPYFIQINGKNGGKKWVQTYESSLDGTIGHYSASMGKFLSTVRYYPEYTEIGKSFKIKSGQKTDAMETFAAGGEFGQYVKLATQHQLGLEYNSRDVLNKGYYKYASNITNFSAWMGLSSPLSGVKNLLIQIPRNVALYGTRNTLKSMVKGYEIWRNPKEFSKAIERGEVGYGLKQVLSEVEAMHGPIKATFEKFNLMKQSEDFNRIVAAEASRMHFNALIPKLRGESSMFFPKLKRAEIMRVLKETFKLTNSEINYLENGTDILGTKRFQKISEWVAHQGHKASAGATGAIDLPLWMQNQHAKPFTLFTRIATSVTIDSYKNYIVPIKNGNVAPLIKAMVGHGLSGAALYGIYDLFIGKQMPNEDSPSFDRMMAYLWKGEALGMFGELISPHDKTGALPLLEPIVIRNMQNLWTEFSSVYRVGKPFSEAINDVMLKTAVVYGQGEQVITRLRHPYARDYKKIKSLEKQWRKRMGTGYTTPTVNLGLATPRQYHYWNLKESIIFGKSDQEIARNYYVALNTVMHELEQGGMSSKRERMKKAKSYLKKVIKKMSPLNMQTKRLGRNELTSKREEFLNSLSSNNKTMALKLEREYEYKARLFEKIIKDDKWRRMFSIYPS